MNTPLLATNHQKSSPNQAIKKDELIRGLELKNNKLKTEIYKIKSVVEEKFSQIEEEPPQKRQSIIKF